MTEKQGEQSAQRQAAACHAAGLHRLRAGDSAAACALLRQAIAQDASVADYHVNLAVALKGLGTPAERIALYRKALDLAPDDPVTHANLAAVLNDVGDFVAAETHARTALQHAPQRADGYINLAGALAGQQRLAEAAAAFDTAHALQPGVLAVLLSSGKAHRAAGRPDLALERFREAQRLGAALPQEQQTALQGIIHDLLGVVLSDAFDHAAAEQQFREALRYRPGELALLTRLGDALYAQSKMEEARLCFSQVAAAAPDAPGAHVNLGFAFHALGRHEEALAEFRAAQLLDPGSMAIYGNIGTCITYSFVHSPAELKQLYDEFDRQVTRPLRDPRPHLNVRNPERPLRVGYLSPDFRKHVVAYFALPLLEGHHADQIETWCYYNHRQQDEWTQRFRQAARGWVDCVNMTDAALAERIRADGIDILVDLAGHTLDNRLRVFARKPAPVQVTWMGYVTTTGLSAMDYRLTHIDADPPGVEADYAETLVRLPGAMWCFRPLPGMSEVSQAPFLRKGHITFGSFNRFAKVSLRVLECWAAIMAGVADSRLVLCIPEGKVRDEVAAFFLARGVASKRLAMFAKLPHAEFWALHGEVDIALDPFPFNGGTTTCETLWLGVPLISCTGGPGSFAPRFASRMGYAMLKAVGLPELAAATEDGYVQTAIELASDGARLVALRAGLRARMAASALMDEAGFVTAVETAYKQIWRTWLASRE